jgi:hypothetical protein
MSRGSNGGNSPCLNSSLTHAHSLDAYGIPTTFRLAEEYEICIPEL